jgi:hypothetical protein
MTESTIAKKLSGIFRPGRCIHRNNRENDAMSHLNRRAVVTGATALPALALPAVFSPARADFGPADKRLFELEREIAIADAHADAAGLIHTESEDAMFEWERRNPKPAMPKIQDVSEEARDDWIRKMLAVSNPNEFCKKNPSPSVRSRKILAEHRKAVSQWEKRRGVALSNCRFEEREVEFERLIEQADALRYEAARIRADTIAGLRTKAAMLKNYDPGRDDHAKIVDSIIAELQAWPIEGGKQ